MILFRFLKLFGVDVAGPIAQLQATFDHRVEVAKDQVRKAAQTAAIVGALAAFAALAALSAAAVGLFALYRWVLLNYGQFYGLAAVGSVLFLIAIILSAVAFLVAKSWSAEGTADQDSLRLKRGAAEAQAANRMVGEADASALQEEPPAEVQPQPAHAATSAADLMAPLSLILSRVMKFPTTGNPVLDELLLMLRGFAKEASDEAVDGVVQTVRYGDRTKLVAVLGGAVLVGWLLARHRLGHVVSD